MKNFCGNEDEVLLWGNVGCCSSPPHSAVAPQLQSWHQSPAGRYAILLCKQLKAAPLHSNYSFVLLRGGLTQYAYTLTPETNRWIAFLRSVFAKPKAIKGSVELPVTFEFDFHAAIFNLTLADMFTGRLFIYYMVSERNKWIIFWTMVNNLKLTSHAVEWLQTQDGINYLATCIICAVNAERAQVKK